MAWISVRGAVAALTFGLACVGGVAQAQNADWDKVVEDGKKEGRIAFYASFIGAQWQYDIVKSFEAKYGIKADVLDIRATELRERIRTEQVSGRYAGDVHWTGFTVVQMLAEGQIAPLGKLPNAANVEPGFQSLVTENYVPTHVGFYGILVNTNLVKPQDEPKSWKDLLDPKWKGKIQADDFRAQGGGLNLFTPLYKTLGREYVQKLAGQNLVFSRDVGNDERRVARGEFPMRVPQFYGSMEQLEGLPVKFVMPEEGGSYTQGLMAVLKGAPHPNAAKLFVNHYLSEEAQTMLAAHGFRPVVKGIGEKSSDPKLRFVAGVKLIGTTGPDDVDPMIKVASEIFR